MEKSCRILELFDTRISYTLSTKKWCEIDFDGDEKKLQKLNTFMRELIAKSKPAGIKVEDLGDEIVLRVPVMMSVAVK